MAALSPIPLADLAEVATQMIRCFGESGSGVKQPQSIYALDANAEMHPK
jgi:hypothetical protein